MSEDQSPSPQFAITQPDSLASTLSSGIHYQGQTNIAGYLSQSGAVMHWGSLQKAWCSISTGDHACYHSSVYPTHNSHMSELPSIQTSLLQGKSTLYLA